MGMKKVYLAGPIAGLTHAEATYSWRQDVASQLEWSGDGHAIRCFSPMRAKKFLGEMTPDRIIGKQAYHEHPVSSGNAITGRDRNDVKTSDLVFMNVLGAKAVSIGTTVELGWADAYRVPVVLCIEKEGNPNDHLFYRNLATYVCDNLDHGIMCARALLLPGVD